MIAPIQRQSLLFFTPLAQQIALLKDDLLDPVDHLLDDDQLVDLVRACLIRRLPNYDADPTPDHTVFSRTFALLGPDVTEQVLRRVVGIACEQGVAQGKRFRVDTTVIESNVHYPTDSSLLGDSIRVLTRSLSKIPEQCKPGTLEVLGHSRAVKYRLLEISRAAQSKTEAGRARM